MKLVDRFFYAIISIQEFLNRFEQWYLKERKYIPWVYMLSFLGTIILIFCEQVVIGEVLFILGMVFSGIENVIGWNQSVRKWLKICIINNMFFSAILAELIQTQIKYVILTPLFMGLYLFVWVFLSLISNSKVALLVNEIVFGIAATFFTIGTYLINIVLKDMPTQNDYRSFYFTNEVIIQALENEEKWAWKLIEKMILETMEVAFISFLPVIGVTALCIIMVKIKIYWMEKNKISELE